MNPGRSADSTAVLPSAVQSSNAVFIDASDVAALRMISTSTMSGTGFMKCMPRTHSGRVVAAPSVAIGIDDVFDARMTSGRAILSSVGEERALGVAILDDGLDDVVGIDERPECRRGRQTLAASPRECWPAACLSRRTFRGSSRSNPARAASIGVRDVDQTHGEARLRERLRDAAAHRPSANHTDRLDSHRPVHHEDTKTTKVIFVQDDLRESFVPS